MANDESNGGQTQEQLPDLYRLLGLTPLEPDTAKIHRALLEMQKKVEAAQKTDVKLAQRAARVVALGKKNLLEAERKPGYDRAWTKAFGAVATVAEPATEVKVLDLEWDLEELESYLPAEDPRSPFDLGGFLRYSASLPESNPVADYDKLQSFLGGTVTATLAPPESISASTLMPEFGQQHRVERDAIDVDQQFAAPKPAAIPQRVPPGGFAKQIRRKRNRAVLMSVGGIVGSLALVVGAAVFWAISNIPAVKPTDQIAQATKPDKSKPSIPSNPAPMLQGSGLPKVAGLDGVEPNPTVEKPAEKPVEKPATMDPAPPMTTEPPAATAPVPTTPAPTVPTPAEPTPMPPPTPAPESTAAPLTDAEKSKWSKAMKETLKTLGNQDFATSKKLLAESEALARTQLQKDQLKRLATVARLAEEYHSFLVDAITGLGAAETIKIGSMEASFIEGNEMGVSLKIRGRVQTSKLTELQVGVANALVDLKMDTAHPKSLACKAAFALVHPKTNDAAIKRAREQMAEAAGAGAVDADMSTVFDEDYSLKK
jgi:hypothetical protein